MYKVGRSSTIHNNKHSIFGNQATYITSQPYIDQKKNLCVIQNWLENCKWKINFD
jgi:hypothetical protein